MFCSLAELEHIHVAVYFLVEVYYKHPIVQDASVRTTGFECAIAYSYFAKFAFVHVLQPRRARAHTRSPRETRASGHCVERHMSVCRPAQAVGGREAARGVGRRWWRRGVGRQLGEERQRHDVSSAFLSA